MINDYLHERENYIFFAGLTLYLPVIQCAFFYVDLVAHLDTKSMNSGDHLSGSRKDGGGFVGIMKIARIGCISP